MKKMTVFISLILVSSVGFANPGSHSNKAIVKQYFQLENSFVNETQPDKQTVTQLKNFMNDQDNHTKMRHLSYRNSGPDGFDTEWAGAENILTSDNWKTQYSYRNLLNNDLKQVYTDCTQKP